MRVMRPHKRNRQIDGKQITHIARQIHIKTPARLVPSCLNLNARACISYTFLGKVRYISCFPRLVIPTFTKVSRKFLVASEVALWHQQMSTIHAPQRGMASMLWTVLRIYATKYVQHCCEVA